MFFEFFVAIRHLMSRERRALISAITGISILGVIVGVAALVSVIAVMDGADKAYFTQLIDAFSHIEFYSYNGEMRNYKDVLKVVDADPDVIAAAPLLKRPAALRIVAPTSETQPMGFAMIMGIDPKREGKVTRIGADSVNEDGKKGVVGKVAPENLEVVLGSGLAEQMGMKVGDSVVAMTSNSSPEGSNPAVSQTKLKVVGIFSSGIYDIDRQVAYTSIPTCQKMNHLPDMVEMIHAKIKNPEEVDAVRARIMAKLEAKYGDAFTARSWRELNPDFFQAIHLQRLALFIILLLIIVVAALNIISTLFLVTMEKTREIGVLRAMGTPRRSIRRIFLIEGAVIGFAGTFLGVVLGLVICWFLKYHFPIDLPVSIYSLKGLPVAIRWITILEIITCSVGISVLASVIPAIQASRLDVVEALRYE